MKERIIKNYDELNKSKNHQIALDIVEAAYEAIDTEKAIRKNVEINGKELTVSGNKYNMDDYENVYIVGCGKVACQVATTLEDVFKDYITDGAVVGIKDGVCEVVKAYKGTHPMPSGANFEATQEIIKIGEKVGEKDLVITVIGGGGSALLCSSQDECDQGQELYKSFLDSGGKIDEINTVRRHISDLKGGGLAKVLYPATVIGLIFSDVPGDDCSVVASGPTYKDVSTIEDAQKLIDKYDLGNFELKETPKEDKYFEKVDNYMLVSNTIAINGMMEKAVELGCESVTAGCDLYNFPDEINKKMQEFADENTVVVAGGETKLVVPEDCEGKGGRNDYLAMYMTEHLKENQIFVSFASDGHDNTDAAGGISDYETKEKIEELGVDFDKHKVCLDSYPVMEQVGALIKTGYIEANVSDLMFLFTFKND